MIETIGAQIIQKQGIRSDLVGLHGAGLEFNVGVCSPNGVRPHHQVVRRFEDQRVVFFLALEQIVKFKPAK